MKNWLFTSVLTLLCAMSFATSVTFSVNMSDAGGGTNGVFIAGSFQGWNATATPMISEGNGVFSYTTDLAPGTYIYKFINGTSWETGNGACGASDGFGGFNRTVTVADVPVVAPLVCFNGCINCGISLGEAAITFSVDMRNETVSPNGVHIAGNFQNWNPGSTAMTDSDGDGIYTYTATVTVPYLLEYKFINGNTWGGVEAVPAACGIGNDLNRSFSVTGPDVDLETVCFSSCEACTTVVEPIFVSVIFSVDMQNEIVSNNGVHIAGNFQGWDPAATEMTDTDGDGVYTYAATIAENDTVEYKFINGNDWLSAEIVPADCGVGNDLNRQFIVSNMDAVLDTVCFSSCAACSEVVEPIFVSVIFNVHMRDETVSAEGVHIAGNFQGWDPAATEMTDTDGDGVYTYAATIAENDTVEYKFINGNDWLSAEIVPAECGVGNDLNRQLILTNADVLLDSICFGSCTLCLPEVQGPTNSITISVNMSDLVVAPEGMHIAGNFQDWNPASTPMTDLGNGIWSYTFDADEWANLSFKFINGNTWAGAENVPSGCGLPDGAGGYNRILQTGTNDFSLGPICFGTCDNCPLAVLVPVTFAVNMNNETVSPNGVHIAGTFQDWDPSSTEMTDTDGDGIYTYATEILSGSEFSFKFINGNTWEGAEQVPSDCGSDDGSGNINRTYTLSNLDFNFGPVCFGGCIDCEPIVEPTTVEVTFAVNMANETVSANGVHVAGNFQGFDPAGTEMTDADGDGVYTATATVNAGSEVVFVFINGNDWPQQEAVPASCGVSNGFGGFNRSFVADADTTFGPICFGACIDCEPIVEPTTVEVTFAVNMANETVSANGVHVAGNFQGFDPAGTEMTDADGDGVYTATATVNAGSEVVFVFINGNDWPQQEAVPASCGVSNGFGGFNRSFVADADTTFGPICFGACTDCEEVVVPGTVLVTLQVNMLNEVVSSNGVHVAGNFQGWSPSATEMTDTDGDGIYEVTVEVDTASTMLFKFINGNDWPQAETVPGTCGQGDGFGGFNRNFDVADVDATYGPVCFSSCTNCSAQNPVLIRLQVDMQNEVVSPSGVFVAGTFNNWSPTATPLTLLGGVYQTLISVNAGETISYKFLNGGDWTGAESVPLECGLDDGAGNINRNYSSSDQSQQVLPVVCFSSCSACLDNGLVNITFTVDLGGATPSPNGVHIAGTFNSFSPSATQMTLVSGSTYTATVAIAQNTVVDYKYLNGNAWGTDESVPFECGFEDATGNLNRRVNAVNEDFSIPTICFGECEACTTSGVSDANANEFRIYPNPANEFIYVESNAGSINDILLYSSTGQLVKRIQTNGVQRVQIDISSLASGVYSAVTSSGLSLGLIAIQR